MARRVYLPKTDDEVEAAEIQIVEQTKRIDFYITEYSVELLALKMKNGDFVVPGYQRNFTWEEDRKSKFIESLLMGLPIPFLFFWEMESGRLEIVDGSQRLRTIEEFINGNLTLGELEALNLVSGFRFSDFPESRQRKILNRSIRGIVLNENADDQARFDMFERINTTSKAANKAEVRRGALPGPFMDLVIELAASEIMERLAPMSPKLVREREREELVTRFFAYGDGLESYRDRPAEFLVVYTKQANQRFLEDPSLQDAYRKRFLGTMEFVERVFPYGFARGASGKATPRARFEAIAVGSFLAIAEDPEILSKDHFNVQDWVDGSEFSEVTGSDGANAAARLKARMDFVKSRLAA